jgi:hypothetical protein
MRSNTPRPSLARILLQTILKVWPLSGLIARYRASRARHAEIMRQQELLLQWHDTNWKRFALRYDIFTGSTVSIRFPPSPYRKSMGVANDG